MYIKIIKKKLFTEYLSVKKEVFSRQSQELENMVF